MVEPGRILSQRVLMGRAFPASVVISGFSSVLEAFFPANIGKEMSILRAIAHVSDGPMHEVLVTPRGDNLGSGSVPEAQRDDGSYMVRIVRPANIGGDEYEILATTRRISYPSNNEILAAEQISGVTAWGTPLLAQVVFSKLDVTKISPWAGIDELLVTVMLASIMESNVGPIELPSLESTFEAGIT